MGSDIKLLVCNIRLKMPIATKPKPHLINKFRVVELEDDSIKLLYGGRLPQKMNENPVNIP